jgi:hypothetical protein
MGKREGESTPKRIRAITRSAYQIKSGSIESVAMRGNQSAPRGRKQTARENACKRTNRAAKRD